MHLEYQNPQTIQTSVRRKKVLLKTFSTPPVALHFWSPGVIDFLSIQQTFIITNKL